jgi:hypothetical protein
LLDGGTPPGGGDEPEAVPVDTRLDARATARVLGVELPALDAMLSRLRTQVESSWSVACRA